jgi:hypothetical protein
MLRKIWELLAAAALAVLVELVIRSVPLPKLARWLGVSLAAQAAEPVQPGLSLERRDVRRVKAVTLVYRYWPVHGDCLRRALVAGHRLRRLHPTIRLGVQRDANGAIAAHAWLEIDGHSWDPTAASYDLLLPSVAASER